MMKRYLLILGAVSLIIIGLSSSAFSYTFGMEGFSTYGVLDYKYGSQDGTFYAAQGVYLGTVFDGNDNVATLTDFFVTYLGWDDPIITFYGKDEDEALTIPDSQLNDENESISGRWQTYPAVEPINPDRVEFIIVKGGTSFSIHRYDPAVFSGEWNIGYLADAGNSGSPATLSHISAYNGSAPVPEPSTILLFGCGLLGLVGYSRKRFSKKS